MATKPEARKRRQGEAPQEEEYSADISSLGPRPGDHDSINRPGAASVFLVGAPCGTSRSAQDDA
jgi:hypothetical protein